MLSASETRLLHALKSRSGREKNQAFIVEGVRVVEEAAAAGIDLKFAAISPSLEDSGRGRALLERLAATTTVRRVSDAELRNLAETDAPQGVLAVARTPRSTLETVRLAERALLLVLDAVQDPGNVGTLIRTADAFAVSAVIALPGTVDYWNSKVVRSAAGATFHVPLISAPEADTWPWLRSNHVAICGADKHGRALEAGSLPERSALVVGNEGAGLRKETRAQLDQLLSISMPGRAESLNVAAAAAILLYEMSRAVR
ncbi:MAG TPA: RNA methyltransferase [Longimicrobiales bacterium]